MNNLEIYSASTRGFADHGWLKARHSFSFAAYYNPERVHFGALRVLNDDIVAPGMGFGTHPHDNMEIITIPLSGALEHRDSMGNHGIIHAGEIQVMSAGTGVEHSEFNHSRTEDVNLFQVWIFPDKKGVKPRYDQYNYTDLASDNSLFQLVSPDKDDEGSWIHQQAWMHLGSFSRNETIRYTTRREGNGIYIMIIEGTLKIDGHDLGARDAASTISPDLTFETTPGVRFLIIDVPMQWPSS